MVESSGWVCQGPSGRASVGRMDRDRSGCAVDGDELAVGQSAGGVDRADDRGDPVIQSAPPLIADTEEFEFMHDVLRPVLTEASKRMDMF